MATLHPFLQMTKFSGKDTDDLASFKEQLEATSSIADIADDKKLDWLKVHLTGGALLFFESLETTQKDTYAKAMTELEARYQNPDRREYHRQRFEQRVLQIGEEAPEDYLIALNRIAEKAFPTTARASERNFRVREQFIRGMPTEKLKLKLMREDHTKPVAELCEQISRHLYLEDLKDGKFMTAFNAVSSENSLVPIVSEIAQAVFALGEEIKQLRASVDRNGNSNDYN